MAIRVDRDVLYFPNHSQYNKNNLIGNGEAPQSKACFGNRGCPCMLFARGSLTVEAAFSICFLPSIFVPDRGEI